MIPWEVFVIVVVVLLAAHYITYTYARKKGEKDFMELLFLAGLMGKTEAFRHYNQYAKAGGIVFVGDSITQDFNVYEYFPNHQVYNRGIGGDTSKGVLTRLEASVFDLKPKKVFLNIGTNDLELLRDGVEAIFKRIQEIITQIKAFDSTIDLYFISVYPVNPMKDPKTVGVRNNVDIEALNDLVKTIKGITFIDAYHALLENGVLNPSFTIEGLHLNQQGYEVLKETMIPYMD